MHSARIWLLFLIGLCFYSCSQQDKKAVALIQKSMVAHGGSEVWNNIQSISMERHVWLFEESGDTVSFVRQENEFRLRPYFEARMNWEKEGLEHKVIFDGSITRYFMGANEIQNEGFLASQKREIDAAFYVLSKPFDLLDKGKKLSYAGKENLPEGKEAEVVKIIDGDPNDPKIDIWWYYFDPMTYEILGYKVQTKDHISMVRNTEWDRSTGILFPSKRTSFRVDEEGNLLFKKASYTYGAFKIQ